VPGLKPVTVIGEEPVPVTDPGFEVAVNDVAVAPKVAAVYVTVAPKPDKVAVPIVGAFGIAADEKPVLIFVALTRLLLEVLLIANCTAFQ
jgi:hypothetical protein